MLQSADGEQDQDLGADWTDLCLSHSTPQLCTSETLHPHTGPISWGGPGGRHSLPFMIHFHGGGREPRERGSG